MLYISSRADRSKVTHILIHWQFPPPQMRAESDNISTPTSAITQRKRAGTATAEVSRPKKQKKPVIVVGSSDESDNNAEV